MDSIEDVLHRAEVLTHGYARDIRAAERRVAGLVRNHLLARAAQMDAAAGAVNSACSAPAAAPEPPSAPARLEAAMRRRARNMPQLCAQAVRTPSASAAMAQFISSSYTEPDGARLFACLLKLTGRDEGARFWWQFAAGAGDPHSAYYLVLHHAQQGELNDAHHWYRQVVAFRAERPGATVRILAQLLAAQDPEAGPGGYESVALWEVMCEQFLAAIRAPLHIDDNADDDLGEIPLPEPDLIEEIKDLATV
ncbi:hypothetical protein QMK19_19530 [Streptomyces sp. H10-C2]|uniref:hypothetical protein n=1 Tax=unclassified Streptomyces TaxID=2593676 RepID=UPI0024B8CAAA|nr:MULTISPECIES: hypothetical protein [unclassified Streptomyces]MDJ0343380.1 hypothetical protein [Streptomyces sp. PH10-H1]MDJ0371809.1 hypothetical protein [Streptomyces sp. H10-C2]